jgi:hypothetical protein
MPIIINKRNTKAYKSIESWSDSNLHVGVFSTSSPYTGDDGEKLTSADIALIHELGTSEIPSRPFITDSFYGSENIVSSAINTHIFDKSYQSFVRYLGGILKGEMQTRIQESPTHYIGNSRKTIDKKGFNHPLVETGRMLRDVNYKIK